MRKMRKFLNILFLMAFALSFASCEGEYQYYSFDGALYERFHFQWYWEDHYNRNLVLDYGRAGISYMDDVRINGNRMRGTFYLSDGAAPFDFELRME